MLLNTLTEEEKRRVVEIGSVHEHPKGETILHEGAASTSIYMIMQGAVQVRKGLDGERYKQLKDLMPGDFFGEMSFLTSTPRSADVIALQDCRILEVPRDAFSALVEKAPTIGSKFYRNIAEELATRLRRNNDELKRAILWALEEMIS